ncbi:glycine receptor subunit alpha-4-like [Pollicipes pollicipes]|uniref:glycine receptor subunit alpha-4-like n=1 Tax=Pollicipes pollicipes TaxID=41117 RepID=UPI0018857FBE|nr:glycine receptor subunit alpha-4-like [Pollicipes pollicipes]
MPPFTKGQQLNIFVTFWIISITEINEIRQDFTVDMYFHLYWTDFRITFPVCEDSPFIIVDQELVDKIWMPDIFFAQGKKAIRHYVVRRNAGLWLNKEKTQLFFSERLTVTNFCAFDFRNFPLDRQVCSLPVETYAFHGLYVNTSFKAPGIQFDNFKFKIPQYTLSSVLPSSCSYDYLYEGSYYLNQSCVQADFTFDRQFSYYFVQMYLPSILIVLVSFLSFWVPVENVPGRVSLGVTSLLTLATQFTTMQRSLPPVSYMKAMDVWMFFCIVGVFLAMVEFTLAFNFKIVLASSADDKKPVPVLQPVATITPDIDPLGTNIKREPKIIVISEADGKPSVASLARGFVVGFVKRFHAKKGNVIDNISKVLFPTTFVVFNVVYWLHYTRQEQ